MCNLPNPWHLVVTWPILCCLLLPLLSNAVKADNTVSCFQPTPHLPSPFIRPGDLPTTYRDCFQIVKFIVRHERVDLPLLFSRQPGRGYLLPETWKFGSCALNFDFNSGPHNEDTTTFRQLAVEAGTIMLGCVAQPPHLGGTQYVGPIKVLNVTVFGVPADAHAAPLMPAVKASTWNISTGN